jgi:hypothetical protein
MRIWSLNPEYLDATGLVSGWREALLAQKVLQDLTVGYKHHPQLTRFRQQAAPVTAIATYLHGLADEADRRGYHFDRTRIAVAPDPSISIPVSDGQVDYEWAWLLTKLAERSPERHAQLSSVTDHATHPMFRVEPGPIASWERVIEPV